MADKYIYDNGGVDAEKEALASSSGSSDAGKIIATGSDGKLDESFLPTGIGAETISAPASEALSGGNYVNIYTDTGAVKCRKADASTSGKEANGFVLAAFASAAIATVYLPGQLNSECTGLTPGAKEYLSVTTPGGTQETSPTGTGQVRQCLGVAVSATEMIFSPERPLVKA